MKKNAISIKIIFCLIFFFIISLISIYSSQNIVNDSFGNILIKQIFFYVIGIIVLLVAYSFKNNIIKHAGILYICINVLLLSLLFLGVSINGSKCWIMIGPVSFQPSEFMKIMLVILVAKILEKNKNFQSELTLFFKIFLITAIPSFLTFLEPDTGVVIIYFLVIVCMLLYRGINKKWYIITLSFIILIIGIIIFLYFYQYELLINILGDNIFYRLERILNWSKGSGYQLENSLITIGSSGLIGFGINNLPLYFPEANTDFIFTTFSANFGFIGNIIFILIILLFDSCILLLINKKTKKLDRFILIGFFSMITYQQIQNISMTIGLLPITGITLPFISYGGTSLLSYMFVTGIILNISNNNRFLN